MNKNTKVAITACSNAQPQTYREKLNKLQATLSDLGLIPIFGDCIYEKESVFSGTGKERAESLMNFYRNPEIRAVFDISGGDIANEILPFLDYDVIAKSNAVFVERQIVANPNIKLNLSFFTLFPQIIPAFSSIPSDYS